MGHGAKPVPSVPPHRLVIGVSPDGADIATAVASADSTIGRSMGIVAWFSDWTQPFPTAIANSIPVGKTPAVFWEPWDHTRGPDQIDYESTNVAAGSHDAYLTQWAADAAAYGRPLLLILAPEMNSESSTWTPREPGSTAFIDAWRHVHDIFTAAGASNVKFVWAPAAIETSAVPLDDVFPGVDYVDAVGMTVFNGGSDLPWGGWRSFDELRWTTRVELERLAPGVDIVYASVGSSEAGGDKAFWIEAMFESVRTDPNSVALIWFDHDKETDWRVESSEASLDAFRAGIDASSGATGSELFR